MLAPALESFIAFLNISWNIVCINLNEDDMNDWLQANWEILVESCLGNGKRILLEPYGEGADCNGDSSRVFEPNKIATHRIICRGKNHGQGKDVLKGCDIDLSEYDFDSFVSWNGEQYAHEPPFEYVLLESDDIAVVKFNEIEFAIERCK